MQKEGEWKRGGVVIGEVRGCEDFMSASGACFFLGNGKMNLMWAAMASCQNFAM